VVQGLRELFNYFFVVQGLRELFKRFIYIYILQNTVKATEEHNTLKKQNRKLPMCAPEVRLYVGNF